MEYIDFAKLLPKDRITKTDDHRLELVYKGGATFFSPVSDRELTSINGFSKWEQAFRIYSNILTRTYPAKAGELIQYNHVIYTASLIFHSDNVYLYDREFRMHLCKFPNHSWAVILQQAWSMCLKDRIKGSGGGLEDENRTNKKNKISEPCHHYNKGKCTYGINYRYEHRCSIKKCGKFGHGVHICRKRNKGSGQSDNNSGASTSQPKSILDGK